MKGKISSTVRQRDVVSSFGARSANQMKPAEPMPCAYGARYVLRQEGDR